MAKKILGLAKSYTIIHPQVDLRKSHRSLCRVKRDLFFKRQIQLTDLVKALAEEKGTTGLAEFK